ncbi:MFS transporter [Candidatus Gracilibacteria bacterium]|nr:MFS transporter [Candidatus Gracilibacteria bacterium]
MNILKSSLPLILITAFLDILGMGILIPILPDIIIHFGVNESWNPYSQGIYSIGMFIGGLLFGRLSDRFGRKNLLVVTSAFNLIGYVIVWLALSTSLLSLPLSLMFLIFLAGRMIGGLGGSGYGVVQAYIADISTSENRAKNMGMIGAMFGLGFLVGPAIGGLLGRYGGTQSVLLACIFAIALNFLLIVFLLPEPKKHQKEMMKENTPFRFTSLTITLLGLSFGASLAFSSVQSGMGQVTHDVFGFSADQIGYTMVVVGLVAIIYQGALMKYVRAYFSEIEMVRGALLVMMISLGFFAINTSPILVYVIVGLFPLAMGTFQPGINSLIASKAGKEVGKVMGYNTSVTSIAGIIGPFIVGTLYHRGPMIPFVASSVFAFLMFLVSVTLLKK